MMLVASTNLDWWQIVTDMERSGLSQREIAVRVGYGSHGSVNTLKNMPGQEPIFGFGVRLLVLWMDRTGKTSEALPRLRNEMVRTPTG